jgi:hypothetical protein
MRSMTDPAFDNSSKGLCIMCGLPVTDGRKTCSERCHEEFIKFAEKTFGVTKKVVDITTGITYNVPTRDIIEIGLDWKDLKKYPNLEDRQIED